MNNIYLCGFMGAGKSYIGKLLADRLSCRLVDTDEYIISWKSKSIPDIFKEYGEEGFREFEHQAIVKLSAEMGIVVSLGGGAVTRKPNVDAMKAAGKVVLLDSSFDVCYERISGDRNRPIVMQKTKDELRELYNARMPIYSEVSDIIIKTEGKTPAQIVDEIIENV